MTAGAYDEDIATALELLAEFGQVCEWRKGAVTLTDPDKPWRGGTRVPVTYNPSIAFIPASDSSSGFGITKLRDGGETPSFNTYGLMAPGGFEPEVTDVVMRGQQQLHIAVIDELRPAEDVVLYILGIV